MRPLTTRIKSYLLSRLESPRKAYERRTLNNLSHLYRFIRKGDVVLVEGDSEISRLIKLFTQSNWSHAAMYVGDELTVRRPAEKDGWVGESGDDSRHMLIEALTGKGVVARPLSKYRDFNIRICRPYGIAPSDLKAVLNHVIGKIGHQYDRQNIIDLALMLIPGPINPFKKHTIRACLGKCNEFEVICSGLIAKAFQKVGYPIVPALCPTTTEATDNAGNPYGSRLMMRHYSQIMPRDFDLSPNFEIVKYHIIGDGKFEYASLWAESIFEPDSGSRGCDTGLQSRPPRNPPQAAPRPLI
jgi:hypothetical protein